MRFSAWMMAAALLAPGLVVHAQESSPYKVDFTIRDTGDAGGKTGRKYSLLVTHNQKTVFKVGNRVPVATGGTSGSAMTVNTQFTYIDVGLNIDCAVAEAGSKFAIHADLDISTAVMPDKNLSSVQNPTISQIKLNLDTILAPGKPTVVASFDDPVTGRKFDLDMTITKM
jgi:Bacterial type II and III secretion system protein